MPGQKENAREGRRRRAQNCGSSPLPAPAAVRNGQRTTDNGQVGHSSFEFPVSSFQFSFRRRASRLDFALRLGARLPRNYAGKARTASRGLGRVAPGAETRVFVDTGPVVERAFARFSGIGWMGKNTCIINQEKGSWFFLGVILTSLEVAPDLPAPDRCGSCTACIQACPTGALVEPYVMDASRCISYFTIEQRASPGEFRPKIGANIFGCDICQDVCPWNSHQLSVSPAVSRELSA